MPIVRWDPFRRMAALQDQINRLFDDSFDGPDSRDEDLAACEWRPVVDIYETGQGVVLKAELPGISKEDVSIEVKDNILTIKGERFSDQGIGEEKYYRKERCFGTFYRSFTMQDAIDPEKIKAKFKDGILEMEIPRPEVETPKQIKVDITE